LTCSSTSGLLLEQAAGSLDAADVQDINRLLTADAESQLAPGDVQQR
jgi:outer membrane protein